MADDWPKRVGAPVLRKTLETLTWIRGCLEEKSNVERATLAHVLERLEGLIDFMERS